MLLVLESRLNSPILHLFYEYRSTKTVVIGVEKSTLPPDLAYVFNMNIQRLLLLALLVLKSLLPSGLVFCLNNIQRML